MVDEKQAFQSPSAELDMAKVELEHGISGPASRKPRSRRTRYILASILLSLGLFPYVADTAAFLGAVRDVQADRGAWSSWSSSASSTAHLLSSLIPAYTVATSHSKAEHPEAAYLRAWQQRSKADASRALSNEQAEEHFLTVPNNVSARDASRSYTALSHVAGTPGDFALAVLVKSQWERLLGLRISGRKDKVFDAGSKESRAALLSGFPDGERARVWTDAYYTLLNYPAPLDKTKTSLTMKDKLGRTLYKAKLAEDPIAEDPTSVHGNADVPPFHGYSKAGKAEGQLVYAHFGLPEDFALLASHGVSLAGKIALVRYGGNFRGLKVKAAQEAGCAGILIYSDPQEDGDITVDNGYLPYPNGPARQPSSLQRGSVQFLSKYPGDPTTPGKPSYKDAVREEAKSIPDIPSLPLSYEDALPLLRSLDNHGPCIDSWKGGLAYQGISYCSGPSPDTVISLFNDVSYTTTPLWNTYAVIPGQLSDEIVLVGNHRDAWVYGASDPNAGTASVFEVVKGLGELMQKKDWKPLRTIVIASWSGEEYGLLGSTEFGEDYPEWTKKVVAYLNLDSAVSGSGYSVNASPSLSDLLRAVSNIGAPPEKPTNETLKIGPLGSGSDYTVFLQHLGVASSDMGYRRTRIDPVYHYHSIYDSEYWMEKYGDPSFTRHVNVAKSLGLAALRLADSLIVPLNITNYAFELTSYLESVQETALAAKYDSLDFSELAATIASIQEASASLDTQAQKAVDFLALINEHIACPRKRAKMAAPLIKVIRSVNAKKIAFEKGFISEKGLNRREWYKHLAVAPGENLGYGATTFPGVTEAMTIDHSESKAKDELKRLNGQLQSIVKLLQGQ